MAEEQLEEDNFNKVPVLLFSDWVDIVNLQDLDVLRYFEEFERSNHEGEEAYGMLKRIKHADENGKDSGKIDQQLWYACWISNDVSNIGEPYSIHNFAL